MTPSFVKVLFVYSTKSGINFILIWSAMARTSIAPSIAVINDAITPLLSITANLRNL
jgi:hypothetical protein